MRLLALLLLACAPTVPYVTEDLVWPRVSNWASAEGNVTKRIRCHNTTAESRWFDVVCDGEPEARLFVPARDAVSMFVDVDVRYSVGEACTCEAVR